MSAGYMAVVMPMYLTETLPPEIRGRGTGVFQLCLGHIYAKLETTTRNCCPLTTISVAGMKVRDYIGFGQEVSGILSKLVTTVDWAFNASDESADCARLIFVANLGFDPMRGVELACASRPDDVSVLAANGEWRRVVLGCRCFVRCLAATML